MRLDGGHRRLRAGDLIEQLGKVKLGKDCIWAGRFPSLNLEVLEELVRIAWSKRKDLQAMFPGDA